MISRLCSDERMIIGHDTKPREASIELHTRSCTYMYIVNPGQKYDIVLYVIDSIVFMRVNDEPGTHPLILEIWNNSLNYGLPSAHQRKTFMPYISQVYNTDISPH